MARRAGVWLVAGGLMAAGSVAAHLVGDLLGASPDGDHAEAARTGSHLVEGAAPLVAGVLIAFVAALVAGRIVPSAGRRLPWLAGALPIAGVLVQETLERVIHAELPGFSGAHDPSMLTAALVQVPVALILVWLARLLVGAAYAVVRRLVHRSRHRLRRAPPSRHAPASARLSPISWVSLGYAQRGPPVVAS
jgi:MFS family permease